MAEILDDRDWLLRKLDEHPGSFLQLFVQACLAADGINWRMLEPAIKQVRLRYPLKPEFLAESAKPDSGSLI